MTNNSEERFESFHSLRQAAVSQISRMTFIFLLALLLVFLGVPMLIGNVGAIKLNFGTQGNREQYISSSDWLEVADRDDLNEAAARLNAVSQMLKGNYTLGKEAWTEVENKAEYISAWGNKFIIEDNLEEAERWYQVGVELEPDNPDLLNGFGTVLFQQEKWEQARLQFKQSLTINPQQCEPWVQIAEVHIRRLDWQLAIEAFDAAIQVDAACSFGRSYLHHRIGNVYFTRIGNLERGERAYREALRLNAYQPDTSVKALSYAQLGAISMTRENYSAAAENFRDAISVNPRFYVAYVDLSEALFLNGEFSGAEENLELAIRLNDRRFEAYLLQGELFRSLGRVTEARAAFSKVLARNANNEAALEGLARLGG